jgi:hypothetical protein
MRHLIIIAATIALSACATIPPPKPSAVPAVSVPMRPTGLERVLGQDARALTTLFGTPDQDVKEEGARRLQYAGPFCILDAYLYPPRAGAEPVVSYMDARQPDGKDIDRASCVAALVRRKEAR